MLKKLAQMFSNLFSGIFQQYFKSEQARNTKKQNTMY